ncbi:MAG TPA: YceI family protein [Parvibaculum sp.]|jgi:polyisoprenoid-binding protein YceI
MRSLAIAIASVAALTLSSFAHADEYEIDGTHTHVGFTISHLGFSQTYGVFKNVAGTLTLDEAKPAASKVDITVQTASLDTANDDRDAHVKGKDFLDVAKYPTMIFKSTKVELTGKDTATVTGDLTLHGVTRPLGLIVKLNKAGPSPMDKTRQVAGFSAIGKLKRSDFGITTYVPAIGDEVTLAISTEAVRK